MFKFMIALHMLQDVHKVIDNCNLCGCDKKSLVNGCVELSPILFNYPWATMGVDMVGPITLHFGEKGLCWVLRYHLLLNHLH